MNPYGQLNGALHTSAACLSTAQNKLQIRMKTIAGLVTHSRWVFERVTCTEMSTIQAIDVSCLPFACFCFHVYSWAIMKWQLRRSVILLFTVACAHEAVYGCVIFHIVGSGKPRDHHKQSRKICKGAFLCVWVYQCHRATRRLLLNIPPQFIFRVCLGPCW